MSASTPGFMVPGAVQLAGAAALADQEHADAQRARYQERLERLQQILAAVGVEAPISRGRDLSLGAGPGRGCVGPGRPLGGRSRAGRLAGEFYGAAGAGHIRVAAVAPMERIELVASRVGAA